MVFETILGHEHVKQLLEAALRSRRLPHAYLFVGARGVGKHATALAMGQALLCEERGSFGCGRCAACRRYVRGAHPDLHVVAPDGQQIKIEQIRILQDRLGLRAFCGGAKVAVLDEADRLGAEAAAAFLKTLEEPPEATHFILVCQNLAAMPLTVVSRCQVVRFGTLAVEHVAQLLRQRRQLDAATARLVAGLSAGCPGQALAVDIERLRDLRRLAVAFLRLGLEGAALPCFELSEQLTRGRAREEVLEFVELLALVARDLLLLCGSRERSDGQPESALRRFLLHADAAAELGEIAACLRNEQVEAILTAILEASHAIRRNVHAQLTLDLLLTAGADLQALAEYRHACRR